MSSEINTLGVAVLLLLGVALGTVGTQQVMDQKYDSLQDQIDNIESSPPDRDNLSRDQTLTRLFQEVDQSVVSIEAYGAENSQGSGFVYTDDGHIVTNEHVIADADRVEVSFTDGTSHDARVVGMDEYSDLAVLKVEKQDVVPLKIGNSTDVQVGQTAIAMGNPFGLRGSMTAGIVSQKDRRIQGAEGFSIPNVIQTDAAINPGNSGGPLMNVKGEVIGVNTAIQTGTGTFSGVGFAIPSNTVKRVAEDIIDEGDVQHPWIGVQGFNMNQDIAEEMGTNVSHGFLIVEIVEDGPAADSGLRGGDRNVTIDGAELVVGGDIIVAMNGNKMRDLTDIYNFLNNEASVGETVDVTVVRDGERKTFEVTLGARENR